MTHKCPIHLYAEHFLIIANGRYVFCLDCVSEGIMRLGVPNIGPGPDNHVPNIDRGITGKEVPFPSKK